MKQTIFIGIVLLLIVASCNKQKSEPLEFIGAVLNAKTGNPMTNVLTVIRLAQSFPSSGQSLIDSIRTDGQGLYAYSIEGNTFNYYHIAAYKTGYVRQGYDRFERRFIYVGKSIDHSHLNNDTLFLGREAILKIKLNVLDQNGTYTIYCDELVHENDSILHPNDYPVRHQIEPYDIPPPDIVERYLYLENNTVPISWFRNDILGDTTIIEVEMIPQDTVYLTLDLQ